MLFGIMFLLLAYFGFSDCNSMLELKVADFGRYLIYYKEKGLLLWACSLRSSGVGLDDAIKVFSGSYSHIYATLISEKQFSILY